MSLNINIKTLVGMKEADAIALCDKHNIQHRIASRDGKANIFTMILWIGVDLCIKNGVVSSCNMVGK